MHIKYIKIIFFVFIYLAGRISLVMEIDSENEYKRFINCQSIPQGVTNEITVAFQKVENKYGHKIKKHFLFFEIENKFFGNNIFPLNHLWKADVVYSGHYIEPPKLA